MRTKIDKLAHDIMGKEANAILSIPDENDYDTAINMIEIAVHCCGGKVITTGMGKAGEIAHTIATTFSSTGTPAIYLDPAEAQHGDLGILQQNDIVIVVSNSGETSEVYQLLDLIEALEYETKVILITGNPNAILASHANLTLWTGSPKEVCPFGLTPTTSTTVMSVIGDILVVAMMKRIAFTKKEYAKLHHGGYLGNKAKTN